MTEPRPKTRAEKAVEQAQQIDLVARFAPLLRLFGRAGREAAQALGEMRGLSEQARELAGLPTRFNAALRAKGWVAYDRMNADLLRNATELAESGDLERAEALLVAAFDDPSDLRFQLNSMSAVEAYRSRAPLLGLAAEDYQAGRYHACVPVVLSQIDGIVADVLGRSLFDDARNLAHRLVAFDSISAQEGGLPDLVLLMASSRHRTTETPIEVPYRHGILHGRDLGYANKAVAAKAWAALFALREWAIKFERGETEPPPVEQPPSLRDALAKLADVERQRKAIEAWRPRPDQGSLPQSMPPRNTPEEALHRWLDAWKRRDFKTMASWTQVSIRQRTPDMALKLRDMFDHRALRAFAIERVHDRAAALCEVVARLEFENDPPVRMIANVINEDSAGHPVVYGTGSARWGVNEVSALRQEQMTEAT